MDLLQFGFEYDISLVMRVVSALLLGSAIGLERELTNKYAGLRTNILVCLGACVFTIISIYGFPEVAVTGEEMGTRDTARVAAQVVTGIGFIGGGTVLRHGATVFGLTTAATLWVSAAIGMACGSGMFALAITSTLLAIMVLVIVRLFEKNVLTTSTKNTKRLKINIVCENDKSNGIYDYMVENFNHLREVSKKHNTAENNTKINIILDVVGQKPIKNMYKTVQALDGVESVSIQEFNE
ncbi:MgtC/SapB family protein [bacterium]|nr:MgtC/SapB family protein [bacterium]